MSRTLGSGWLFTGQKDAIGWLVTENTVAEAKYFIPTRVWYGWARIFVALECRTPAADPFFMPLRISFPECQFIRQAWRVIPWAASPQQSIRGVVNGAVWGIECNVTIIFLPWGLHPQSPVATGSQLRLSAKV